MTNPCNVGRRSPFSSTALGNGNGQPSTLLGSVVMHHLLYSEEVRSFIQSRAMAVPLRTWSFYLLLKPREISLSVCGYRQHRYSLCSCFS